MRGGWLHTGDLGRLDEDGYLYVVDRKKDLIIRGGFNVFPRDVEEALLEHPAVAAAGVVGRPDAARGEEVVAFVALRAGNDIPAEELVAWARSGSAATSTRARCTSSPRSRSRRSGRSTAKRCGHCSHPKEVPRDDAITLEELEAAGERDLGTSDWRPIDQHAIDAFAEATHDHQWIHVDPEMAAEGPFGATVAHGYLSLSLLPLLMRRCWRSRARAWASTTGSRRCGSRRRSRPAPGCG